MAHCLQKCNLYAISRHFTELFLSNVPTLNKLKFGIIFAFDFFILFQCYSGQSLVVICVLLSFFVFVLLVW